MSSWSTSSDPADVVASIDVTMPQMGVSVAEGTVVEWRVEVGDRIEADETICEISTDKIDTEVPAPASGTVTEILVPTETTVGVGAVLARIAADQGGNLAGPNGNPTLDGHPASVDDHPTPPDDHPTPADDHLTPPDDHPNPVDLPRSGNGRERETGSSDGSAQRYSPVVQRLANDHGIDLSGVSGTGRGGRVRKKDVLAIVKGESQPAPSEPQEPQGSQPRLSEPPKPPPRVSESGQLPRTRRQIGEHMKRSLDTAAHCTTWIEVDMYRVEETRARLGVTALALVARAAIDALREHPALNASIEDDSYAVHSDINLGIAVSLGEDGLIVPVIHRAHELSAEGLAARIKELAGLARARELAPEDVRGGTFTITNPGQYGSIMATPIINQPQVAILDLEAIVKRTVVLTDSHGNDSIAIRPTTILGLSWDHRALDGALAAQFLASVKRHLEDLTAA